MRKAVLLMYLLSPVPARAQEITIGAHGGVSVIGEGAAKSVNPVAGASIETSLFPPFTLRLEAEYAENGAHVGLGTGANYSLGYLAIPINLRYDLFTGTLPVYLFAGTTVGALLRATQE